MSVEENSLNVVIPALCRQAMQHMSFKQSTVTPSGGGPGNNFGDHCASSSSCKGTKRSTNNGVCLTDCDWKIKQFFKNKTPEDNFDYFSLNLLSIYQVGPTGQMMTTYILSKASLRDITKTMVAMVDSALRRQETKIVINSTPHQISATSNHAVHFTVS